MQDNLITLPKISDSRGSLTFIESNVQVPFEIKRVYYLYDVPGGEWRGGHAHKDLEQLIISVAGSFEVRLDNGISEPQTFHLSRSYIGLYVPKMTWREIHNFSGGSVCLVLASRVFEEKDYYRDYNLFMKDIMDCKRG